VTLLELRKALEAEIDCSTGRRLVDGLVVVAVRYADARVRQERETPPPTEPE